MPFVVIMVKIMFLLVSWHSLKLERSYLKLNLWYLTFIVVELNPLIVHTFIMLLDVWCNL
jgi:hypothetical protein